MAFDAGPDGSTQGPRWNYLYSGGVGAIGVGLLGSLFVAASGDAWTDGFRWILYLLAAAAASGILGLIFGLPRSLSNFQPTATERYRGNSNLEEISDWLTKLLVGVGLVQLTQAPGLLRDLSDYLSQDMKLSNASAYVSAAVVYGVAVGFLFAYLWSRLRLRYLFEFSDRQATLASTAQRARVVADRIVEAARAGDEPEDLKKVKRSGQNSGAPRRCR